MKKVDNQTFSYSNLQISNSSQLFLSGIELAGSRSSISIEKKFLQQEIDVSTWLIYPRGTSSFPLFSRNNGQVILTDSTKMHVLIEADLSSFNPVASTKATKVKEKKLTLHSWNNNVKFNFVIRRIAAARGLWINRRLDDQRNFCCYPRNWLGSRDQIFDLFDAWAMFHQQRIARASSGV